jgi:hypothetical protein
VRGDFKSGRVKDPTAPVNSKHEKVIKTFVKDFMEKAVKKKVEREEGKSARAGSKAGDGAAMKAVESPETPYAGDEAMGLNDREHSKSHDISPVDSSLMELKRKREGDGSPASPKKSRTDIPPAPPTPPPPPTEDMPDLDSATLTPLEDESTSFLSSVEVGDESRLQDDDIMQLRDYANGRSSTKVSLIVQGGP